MIVTLSFLQQTPMILAVCSQKLSGSVPVFLEKTYIMNTMSVTVYEAKDVWWPSIKGNCWDISDGNVLISYSKFGQGHNFQGTLPSNIIKHSIWALQLNCLHSHWTSHLHESHHSIWQAHIWITSSRTFVQLLLKCLHNFVWTKFSRVWEQQLIQMESHYKAPLSEVILRSIAFFLQNLYLESLNGWEWVWMWSSARERINNTQVIWI